MLFAMEREGDLETALRVRCATGVEESFGKGVGGGGKGMVLVFFSFFTSGFLSFFFTSVEGGVVIIFLTQALSSSR